MDNEFDVNLPEIAPPTPPEPPVPPPPTLPIVLTPIVPSKVAQFPEQLTAQLAAQFPAQLAAQLPAQMPSQMPSQLPAQLPSQMPSPLPAQGPSPPFSDRYDRKPFDFKNVPTTPIKSDDDTHSTLDNWSTDIEYILEDIRANSEILAKHHKQSYIALQAQLIYFRVPLIILSALNSVFSVGLGVYIDQQTVSTTNCLISLICACISSVELFLQIQKKLELELTSFHGYYLLGTKVSAELKLERAHRETEGLNFLHSIVSEYNNLFEQSCVDKRDIDDKLVSISGNPLIKPRLTIK